MSQHPARGKQQDGESHSGEEEQEQDEEGQEEEKEETADNIHRGFFDSGKNPIKLETTGSIVKLKMGSTDSASNSHSGGTSTCGLVGSLFPSSCRGRAESFARRLHRRLTSLGGDKNFSEDTARCSVNGSTETCWLDGTGQRTTTKPPGNSGTLLSSEERVFECQPRHSPESDIFYDLDLEPTDNESEETTISPAEMANAAELAKILVNPRILRSNHHEACHCSPGARPPPDLNQDTTGAGCVFSSPLTGLSPDTDTSEAYYDPESSETEFFDPGGTSESDAASNLTNGGAIASKSCKIIGRRRAEKIIANVGEISDKSFDQDSETSSFASSCNDAAATLQGARPMAINVGCSSEESINGKSSLETTSPSHESLWSTFDDSTMSLQDESPSTIDRYSVRYPITLGKSHSDSEIIANNAVILENLDEVDFFKSQRSTEISGDKDTQDLQDISCLEIERKIESLPQCLSTENEISTIGKAGLNIATDFIVACSHENQLAALKTTEESVTNVINICPQDSYGNDEMTKLVERLALGPNVDAIVDGEAEEKPDDENADEHNEEADDNDNDNDDDDDDDDDRPRRVRRCSSLKTGKTPPGTPGRKKIVRFADVLGLDLVDVRTFLDEIPKVPNSAYSDLIYDEAFQKDPSPVNFWGTGPATFTTPLFAATMGPKSSPLGAIKLDRILVPLFQQPGGLPNFIDLVRERKVCLENVVVQDPVTICLQGTVRVRNLDFHKSVHVRYSLDSWRNFSDLQANYAINSCDGFSDKFTFALYCHTLKVGQRLELAVRFQCKGTQYWDNNAGINYCFQCLPASTANPPNYIPITQPSTGNPGTHEWSPAFY